MCGAAAEAPGACSSQPMEELEQEIVPGKEVECLTNRLQAHFRRGGGGCTVLRSAACALSLR